MNDQLLQLVETLQKEKIACMLAPSFPVDFEFPQIITQLRKIGCDVVTELTYAAKMINIHIHQMLKENPEKQYICTNCPTVVKYIKTKHPQHTDKLMNIGSPMVITSRFMKKEYGKTYKTLFVGPCLAKKLEAKESGDVDYAITFKELQEIFKYYQEKNIPYQEYDTNNVTSSGDPDFDKFYNDYTKVYPLTGAVADTLHYKGILEKDQIIVDDEIINIDKAIQKMENDSNIKFLDLLSCPGGCIGGPGVISQASTLEKAEKVKQYKEYCKKDKIGDKLGKFEYAEGLDFSSNIT